MPRRTAYPAGAPCWIDRVSADLTAAQRWYGPLFGWTFADEAGNVTARKDGEIVAGFGSSAVPLETWTVYLATKNLAGTLTEVTAAGGKVTMGPIDVGEFGRLALAMDPAGATVGFWEGHRPEGVVLADEPGAACGYQLRVRPGTLDAATAFYAGLFGEPQPYDVAEDGSGRPGWVVYFGVADLAATALRALSAGARVTGQNDDGSVVFRDPRGAVFGLMGLGA